MNELQIDDAVAARVFATVHFTNKQIVSEEYQNQLMYWRDMFRIGQFNIGDIANDVIIDCAMRGIAVNHDRIDEAIGSFCGKTGRTVRYYRETAGFFPKEIRRKYDMLPFSHFVFARTMGKRWEEVLDYAAHAPNMTEKGLQAHFLHESPGGIALFSDEEARGLADSDCETPLGSADAQKIISEISPRIPASYSQQAKLRAISAFAASLDGVISLVESSNAPADIKAVLVDALEVLKKHLPEVLRSTVI